MARLIWLTSSLRCKGMMLSGPWIYTAGLVSRLRDCQSSMRYVKILMLAGEKDLSRLSSPLLHFYKPWRNM
nr:hypothetical protein Iba_chr06aCG14330 [Ipomoea batatas]GME07969.1 hypothetical protein Iba_scaffold7104CG0050 [Ipomoea batatas]